MKPIITPSIQYWERSARRESEKSDERAVVGEDQPGDVPGDDEPDLQVPGVVLAEDAVVDRCGRGPEQVPALAERIRDQVDDRLTLEDQEREVMSDDVDEGDRNQRVDEGAPQTLGRRGRGRSSASPAIPRA